MHLFAATHSLICITSFFNVNLQVIKIEGTSSSLYLLPYGNLHTTKIGFEKVLYCHINM